MAYKQPYKNVNSNNDGASEPITALILGAAKLGKVIAGAVKAGKVAAAGAKAAKAGKLATKAAKLAKSGKSVKASKVLAKSQKVAAKGKTKLTKAANWSERAKKAGNFADKIEAGTTKAQKAVTSVKDKAKGSKIGAKVSDKVDKFKDGYDKVAGKIADKTGFDKQNIKDFGAEKGREILAKGGETVMNKLSQGSEQEPAERGTPNIMPKNVEGSYEDPQGPNMFEHRKDYGPSMMCKYDNVGPSMKEIKTTNADGSEIIHRNDGASNKFGTKSNTESNLFKTSFGETTIGNFSAPITVKGVTFDAGDVLRLGIMGYKGAKKGIENYRHEHRGERALRKHDKALKKSDPDKYKEMKASIKKQKQQNKIDAKKPQMSLKERRNKIILYNAKKKPTMAQNVIGLNKRKYDNIV